MDCIFKGLKTSKCGTCQKCVGIEQLILELGGSSKFAKRFSQYVFFRSFIDKLVDQKYEILYNNKLKSKENILSKLQLHTFECLLKISKKFVGNPFQLEKKFAHIERKTFLSEIFFENSPDLYFTQVGEGYGFFFYFAALGATKSLKIARKLRNFGRKVGSLVSLRDALKDFKLDQQRNKFNPFLGWDLAKIRKYYIEKTKELQSSLSLDLTEIKDYIPNRLKFLSKTEIDPICGCSKPDSKSELGVFKAMWLYIFTKESFCTKFIRQNIFPQQSEKTEKSLTSKILQVGRKIGVSAAIPMMSILFPSALATTAAQTSSNGGCCCNNCCDNCASSICDSCCTGCCERNCSGCCNNCGENCSQSCADSCTCSC